MKSDALFFELLKFLPDCMFRLLPDSPDSDYRMEAIEYKQSALRIDAVFWPIKRGKYPVYILEVQFYYSEKTYGNLIAKMGQFWNHTDANQVVIGVVIYPSRAIEQTNLGPYQKLLDSGMIQPIYLDEIAFDAMTELPMKILELIVIKPKESLEKAKTLLPQIRAEESNFQRQKMMVQFVETIILAKFPQWSREEMETVLQVTDLRETRIFQEALEEGREEGILKGRLEGKAEGRLEGEVKGKVEAANQIAAKLLQIDLSVARVAELTGLSVAKVRQIKRNLDRPEK